MQNIPNITMKKTFERIAIVNTTHIGTMLMTIPLVNRVKRRFPAAEITVILVQRNAVLENMLTDIGVKIHVMPNFDGKKKYLYVFSTCRKFWKKFDLCINGLEPRKIDHILAWGIAKETIAYTENNWHSKLITYPVPFNKKTMQRMHQAQFISNVFDEKILTAEEWPKIKPDVYPIDEKNKKTINLQNSEYRYVFISASNNRKTSSLLPVDYKNILISLCEKYSLKIIINCLSNELPVAEKIKELLSPHARIILTSEFSMLVQLMSQCDFFLLGDGGLSHISAALDKPSLILFGQTSPIEWKPLSEKCTIMFDEKDVKSIDHNLIRKKLETLINKSSA